MNIEIINKLDEITNIIESDSDLKKMKELKTKIENNSSILNKISKIKSMDQYDPNYVTIKKEIIENADFKEFKKLENELYFIVMEINKKLNNLKEKSGCN